MPRKKSKSKIQIPKSDLVIQFVGRRRVIDKKSGHEKLVPAEAPTLRINGNKTFKLPSDEQQKKGFTHEQAADLLSLYPKEFKKKVSKGKK